MPIVGTLSPPSSPRKRLRLGNCEEVLAYHSPHQSDQWKNLESVCYDKLWFDDGNVVIRALAYGLKPWIPIVSAVRCHKSILKLKSQYFRNVFDQVTQAFEEEPTQNSEGELCLDLTEDFEEIRHLLHDVYGLPDESQDAFEPADLASSLCPSQPAVKDNPPKGPELLAEILGRHFPNDYDDWISNEEHQRRVMNPHHDIQKDMSFNSYTRSIKHELGDIGSCSWPDPARVLVLAEKFNLTNILRSAWYDVCRFSASGPGPLSGQDVGQNHLRRTAYLDTLNDKDIRPLILGRERLRDVLALRIASLSADLKNRKEENPYDGCVDRVKLSWDEASSGDKLVDMLRDPLGEFVRLKILLREEATWQCFRDKCAHEVFQPRLHAIGKEIWDMLPKILGFELEQESSVYSISGDLSNSE